MVLYVYRGRKAHFSLTPIETKRPKWFIKLGSVAAEGL